MLVVNPLKGVKYPSRSPCPYRNSSRVVHRQVQNVSGLAQIRCEKSLKEAHLSFEPQAAVPWPGTGAEHHDQHKPWGQAAEQKEVMGHPGKHLLFLSKQRSMARVL